MKARGKRSEKHAWWWIPLALLAILLALPAHAAAQAAQDAGTDAKRAQALDLYRQHKHLEALPLLEELATANPSDALVEEGLGVCLLTHAATVADAAKKQEESKRAHAALLRANELGDSNEIVRILLQMTDADGSSQPFSDRSNVEAAMREGEAAYARRDMDAAIDAYTRARLLDPHLYHAPLFIGDCYFFRKDYANAEAWFAVAVTVDGDKETAYRYWGDALLGEKKVEEAHAKYIEAVIANPYSKATWAGLGHWSDAAGRKLSQPQIQPPGSVSGEGGKVNITIDPSTLGKNDGSFAWTAYQMNRALWKGEKFSKQFPNEKQYRHSLAEESESLGVAVSSARSTQKKNSAHLAPALKTLIELSDRGLLDAYILLAMADDGIAQDYVAYRTNHRAELRRYLSEYVGTEKK